MNRESQLAAELVQRFQDLSVVDTGRGDVVHAGLAEGAFDEYFDPNTGGFVWLSHSLHRVDDQVLHVVAGCDSVGVFRSLHATSAEAAGNALYELCGEDRHLQLAEGGYVFPKNWSQRQDTMAAILARFRERKGLPDLAPEQLLEQGGTRRLTDVKARQWLESFLQQRDALLSEASTSRTWRQGRAPAAVPEWTPMTGDALNDKSIEQALAAKQRLATPMPEVLIKTTDEYGRGFRDAVESFIAAGANAQMVTTVLDAFDNNAAEPEEGMRP